MTVAKHVAEERLIAFYRQEAQRFLDEAVDGTPDRQLDETIVRPAARPLARRGITAVAAALVLLTGTVGALSVRHGSRPTGPAAAPVATTPPRLMFTAAPKGYVLTAASDVAASNFPATHSIVYRNAGTPLGGPAILARTLPAGEIGAGASVSVAGHDAVLVQGTAPTALRWVDESGVLIELSGWDVAPSVLLEAGASAVLREPGNPAAGIDLSALPSGFTAAADEVSASPVVTEVGLTYSNGTADIGVVSTSATAARPLEQYAAATGGTYTPVTVRGIPGYAVDGPSVGMARLVWSERPGSLTELMSTGLSLAQLEEAANALSEPSPAAWEDLLASVDAKRQTFVGSPGCELVAGFPTETTSCDAQPPDWRSRGQ